MGSVTGTLVQEVQADALGTWRVAVPWTRPVAGSSARTVSFGRGTGGVGHVAHECAGSRPWAPTMATATLLPTVSRPVT